MDDRSTTVTSSPGCEHEDLPLGVADELAVELGRLDADADHDADEAVTRALADHREMLAGFESEWREAVNGAIVVAGRMIVIVAGDDLVIGRSGEHRIDHPLVSRRHVAIAREAGGLVARDLGSANGSWVVRGSERIEVTGEGVELVAFDRIVTAGDVELLRVPGAP